MSGPATISELYALAQTARTKLLAESRRSNLQLCRLVAHAGLFDSLSAELYGCSVEEEFDCESDAVDVETSDTTSDSETESDSSEDLDADDVLCNEPGCGECQRQPRTESQDKDDDEIVGGDEETDGPSHPNPSPSLWHPPERPIQILVSDL